MSKLFGSRSRAYDRVGIMTSDEPWRFFGNRSGRLRTAEDTIYCEELDRDITLREDAQRRRDALPDLLWVRVERRVVTRTAWDPVEEIVVPPRARQSPPVTEPLTLADMFGEWAAQTLQQATGVLPNGHHYTCGCVDCTDDYVPF